MLGEQANTPEPRSPGIQPYRVPLGGSRAMPDHGDHATAGMSQAIGRLQFSRRAQPIAGVKDPAQPSPQTGRNASVRTATAVIGPPPPGSPVIFLPVLYP